MKIAIIGSGISGMTAAHMLSKNHHVTLFEAGSRVGGHTATVDVEEGDKSLAIDTGFIVYNDWTYPKFIALLDKLGVEGKPTDMSFSVSDKKSGIEYAGSNLNTLFGQRKNLFSPRFWQMLSDILKFNKDALHDMEARGVDNTITLGDYLEIFGYSETFRDLYLVPMGAAIWSSSQTDMLKIPLCFFVRFLNNHGLLNISNRPQWYVVKGGSRNYIPPLIKPFEKDIRLNCPVYNVSRLDPLNGLMAIKVQSARGVEIFDRVVFACHSDQALSILDDASHKERNILGNIPYSRNEVVLHTDSSLLPKSRRCWSSWNVVLGKQEGIPQLTYNMNILQGIESEKTYCVSLNQTSEIRDENILGVYQYDHPIFGLKSLSAQQSWQEINGVNNTWFCGAYWRNGFHEDGVWSAMRVAEAINQSTNQALEGAA